MHTVAAGRAHKRTVLRKLTVFNAVPRVEEIGDMNVVRFFSTVDWCETKPAFRFDCLVAAPGVGWVAPTDFGLLS